MGILDWLSGSKGTPDSAPAAGAKPLRISYRFSPLRLKARRNSKVSMHVSVTNAGPSAHLVSVDVELPRAHKAGFDVSSSQTRHEERMGELGPGQTKDFSLSIYSNPLTKEGEVPIRVTAYSHYLNYSKVLEQFRREMKLRII